MKVLFVSRGKKNGKISPFVYSQFISINPFCKQAIFPVEGKGLKAYINNVFHLRNYIKKNLPDVIHAHYAWMGMIASLATRKTVVVSLMGSDIEDFRIGRILIRIFDKLFWKAVIVKSQRSKDRIRLKKAIVIPNGVNMEIFRPTPQHEARQSLGFRNSRKYVLFLADPSRPEKNFALAEKACSIAGQWHPVELMALKDIPHEKIPLYLSAADALLLSSHFEGSPNAVKEAMACNCPIVSTDVGDVKEVIGDTEGCYITSYDPLDVAEKLKQALDFGKRTNGREKIKHLDEKIIAEKLVEIYKSVLNK
jgi:teichuronic acid biosynthesis glycosyltransferase TuaC